MDERTMEQLKSFLCDQHVDLQELRSGKVADYIPQLASNSVDTFAISMCTVDGRTFSVGDSQSSFSIQSCIKPFMYCYARSLHGRSKVHAHVGYEPSGTKFNAFVLNDRNLPHNPMVNAGAIMVSSLIHPDQEPSARFDRVMEMVHRTAGLASGDNDDIGFDNSVYLSERHHADRNTSLAYYMRGSGAYGTPKPKPSEIQDSLDLYFQSCSVGIDSDIGARMAATLANGGINPVTGEAVFDANTVRDCMSLMYSCGMYDYSGQFAFDVGFPAKSGVSGCVMAVVPGKFGICVWSPPLDALGNSVRGIELCRRLSSSGPGNYHMFRHIGRLDSDTENPDIAFALVMNDVKRGTVTRLARYLESVSVNQPDYDGRTALHIACSEGHTDVILYLLERGAHAHVRDRWGHTALDDLTRFVDSIAGDDKCIAYAEVMGRLSSGD